MLAERAGQKGAGVDVTVNAEKCRVPQGDGGSQGDGSIVYVTGDEISSSLRCL